MYVVCLGLGINAGFSPKELTPELAVSIGAMNSSLSVSGSQGDVDAKLYKGDTDVFYFTELVTQRRRRERLRLPVKT